MFIPFPQDSVGIAHGHTVFRNVNYYYATCINGGIISNGHTGTPMVMIMNFIAKDHPVFRDGLAAYRIKLVNIVGSFSGIP